VFKNKVVKSIHGPKDNEVCDTFRGLYNEEQHEEYGLGISLGSGDKECIQKFAGEDSCITYS